MATPRKTADQKQTTQAPEQSQAQDQDQVQQDQEQEQEQTTQDAKTTPAPAQAPKIVKRLSRMEILEKVKTAAKKAALAIAEPVENALENYEKSAVGDIISEAIAKFYVSHGGSIPEAQVKAAASEFIKERVVTNFLKAPDKEGRRNIVAMAMKTFFYQMGGHAAEQLHDIDPNAMKEAAEDTLETNQRLTPADKAKRNADAKKKQEEQNEQDAVND